MQASGGRNASRRAVCAVTRHLRPEPLTAASFRPFGDVVDPPGPGERPTLGATLTALEPATLPLLSFNHVEPWPGPLVATEMERHTRSSQCFIPLDVARWVLLVAPDRDGAPDMLGVRAFVARGDQAVNYHVSTWHHPLRVLDRPARFAVLMWTTGHKPEDEEWAILPEPIQVELCGGKG
jgi:ureidoglycolate lyase